MRNKTKNANQNAKQESNNQMRIDMFLSSSNIVKRRSVSEDMLNSKVVSLNGKVVKKASKVKIGDKITIAYLEKQDNFIILDIPKTKHTPKSEQDKFIKKV
jgi:ribosomal 50S subunit-recycling heat shock protein